MKAIKTLEAVEKYNWPYRRSKVCELTLNYNCNARCVFCYSSPEMDEWKNKHSLTLKKAVSYMAESYAGGSRVLQLIGGEPTLYPELEKIVRLGVKIGYPAVQIVTNGQNMSEPAFVNKLAEAGLNSATFSIHGPSAGLHDEIVGIKGAFVKTLKGLENCVRAGIHLTVGTAVTSLNYKKIPELVAFLYGKFGIESFHIIGMHFIGIASENSGFLKISYSSSVPYVKKALALLAEKRVMPVSAPLSNFQPCLMPGFEHLISDWKYPAADDDLFLPEKVYRASMYTMITDKLRMKGPRCRLCVYNGLCAGFEKEYFKIYGDKEFAPLRGVPAPFPLSSFYGG